MYKKIFYYVVSPVCIVFALLMAPRFTYAALQPVNVTTLDDAVTSYASFGSYNQHVVQNQYGIFLTYMQTENPTTDGEDNGIWKLMRSTDGGQTFTVIHQEQSYSKAPAIQTDSNGTLYLATGESTARLLIFSPADNFATPTTITIPGDSDGKFTLFLDSKRQQLYYFSHYAHFSVIGLDGHIIRDYQFGGPFAGPHASYQYPLLTMDETGRLIAAWTTEANAGNLYWDIHFAISDDGALTWHKLDGTPLTLPIVPDDTGAADRVTLDDEFTAGTWLATVLAKDGKLYFAYAAVFPSLWRQHFVRYDLNTKQKDLDIQPGWSGETITFSTLHIGCATKVADSSYPIYCVANGGGPNWGKIVVLVSYDQGATWHDYAASTVTDTNPWSVTVDPEITSDGYLLGMYTNQVGNDVTSPVSAVRFFRIPVSASSPLGGDLNGDGKVDIFDYNILVANFGHPYTIFDYNTLVGNFGK